MRWQISSDAPRLIACWFAIAATQHALAQGADGDEVPRRVPGEDPPTPYVPPPVGDPNARGGLSRIPIPDGNQPADFIPIPDRWRLAVDLGLIRQRWFDPYNNNILKGDRPFFGDDWFASFGFISDTIIEPRNLPIPVSPGGNAGLSQQSRDRDQLIFAQTFLLPFILTKGDTTFEPPIYEFRLTPVIQVNHVDVSENRALFVDPLRGSERTDTFFGIQELFLDYHLRNVSPRFDFDSIRFGIQPFSSDFRGFLFQDLQLGVRLFGNRDNNLWQYNLAWFRRLEKDTNSGLNDLTQRVRDDDIFAFNLYRQDFPFRGFTSQGTVIHNRNREGDNPIYYDDNGFVARPNAVGAFLRGRNYDVTYVGYNGDGHYGRFNLTVSAYGALGDQNFASSGSVRGVDIRSVFAAGELSYDMDWIRPRVSILYASGDSDPLDNTEGGFDAIFENPIFAGADTSFWIRQNVPFVNGGGVALSGRNGILNSLRSSKELGQSNFNNPGIQLYGAGVDADLLPELRVSGNVNKLYFDNTTSLRTNGKGATDPDIGWDISGAIIWRPYFTQNIVTRLSGAVLVPGDGYEQLNGDALNYSVLGNIVLTY